MRKVGRVLAAGVFVFAAACSGSGAGGREVQITQRDDGCTPTTIVTTPGEKLKRVIKNESSHDPYEVEGIEGTKFEELNVPEGRTRSAGYAVPDSGDVHKLKCYVPGGVNTVIEVRTGGVRESTIAAAEMPRSATSTASTGAQPEADETLAVALASYSVTPEKTSVKAGTIRFVATNTSSTQVHEFAVLRLASDGSLDRVDEIEGIDPEKAATLTVALTAGSYQLACLIAAGEFGSTVDHYQQGMHVGLEVGG